MPAALRETDVLGLGGLTPSGGGFNAPPARGGVTTMDPAQMGGLGVSGTASVGVNGTPSRVALMLLTAGATLAALKLGGFRFNVGVSN